MKKFKITESTYRELRSEYSGICTHCGTVREGNTEPDASEYPCEACGNACVSGIENLLLDGTLTLVKNERDADRLKYA